MSALLVLVGCDNTPKLTIKGHISGVDSDTLTLKKLQSNGMIVIEKQTLKSDGSFKFKIDKEEFPQFYFLRVEDGPHLVVIRDSSDVISVEAKTARFNDLNIVGSDVSERIEVMNKRVSLLRSEFVKYSDGLPTMDASAKEEAISHLLTHMDEVKEFIGKEIFKDPSSYYAYYALYQRLSDEYQLFSPYDEDDYTYFATVATSFDLHHKDDPRTKALYDMVSSALAQKRKAKLAKMIEDAPATLPDIVMDDVKGNERKLSDLRGKIVILNFWASKSQESRLLNVELKKLYKQYKSKGLDVFQVSADKSKILWEDAIINDKLPWTNVCDFKEGNSSPLVTYNVRGVPTTYLISRTGEMIGKYNTLAELEKAIKAAL